jgi:hypothetical protein
MASCVIKLRVTSVFILRGKINILIQNWCTESYTAASSNHSGLEFLDR